MSTHELARLLLDLPDVSIKAWDPDTEQDEEITGIVYSDQSARVCTDEP